MESGEEVIVDGQPAQEPVIGWGGQADSTRMFNHNPYAAFGESIRAIRRLPQPERRPPRSPNRRSTCCISASTP